MNEMDKLKLIGTALAAPNHRLLRFDYVNYRKEQSVRKVKAYRLEYTRISFHGEETIWVMTALDIERSVMRSFAVRDMTNITIIEEESCRPSSEKLSPSDSVRTPGGEKSSTTNTP